MILFNSKYKGCSVKLRCPHCYGEIQAYSKGTEKLIDNPPFILVQKAFSYYTIKCPYCKQKFLTGVKNIEKP